MDKWIGLAKEAESRLMNTPEFLDELWLCSYTFLALVSLLANEAGIVKHDSWTADLLTNPDLKFGPEWPYTREDMSRAVLVRERAARINQEWLRFCEKNELTNLVDL